MSSKVEGVICERGKCIRVPQFLKQHTPPISIAAYPYLKCRHVVSVVILCTRRNAAQEFGYIFPVSLLFFRVRRDSASSLLRAHPRLPRTCVVSAEAYDDTCRLFVAPSRDFNELGGISRENHEWNTERVTWQPLRVYDHGDDVRVAEGKRRRETSGREKDVLVIPKGLLGRRGEDVALQDADLRTLRSITGGYADTVGGNVGDQGDGRGREPPSIPPQVNPGGGGQDPTLPAAEVVDIPKERRISTAFAKSPEPPLGGSSGGRETPRSRTHKKHKSSPSLPETLRRTMELRMAPVEIAPIANSPLQNVRDSMIASTSIRSSDTSRMIARTSVGSSDTSGARGTPSRDEVATDTARDDGVDHGVATNTVRDDGGDQVVGIKVSSRIPSYGVTGSRKPGFLSDYRAEIFCEVNEKCGNKGCSNRREHSGDNFEQGDVCRHADNHKVAAVSQATKRGQEGVIVDQIRAQDGQPNNSTSRKDGASDVESASALLVRSELVGSALSQPVEGAEDGSREARPHTRVKLEECTPAHRPRHSLRRRIGETAHFGEGRSCRIGYNSSYCCDERVKKRMCGTTSIVCPKLPAEGAAVDASSLTFHEKEEGVKMELRVRAPFPPVV